MPKVLKSFMVMSLGMDRISYRYDEVDNEGNPTSKDNEGNLYAVDATLEKHINAIRDYIRKNKLAE